MRRTRALAILGPSWVRLALIITVVGASLALTASQTPAAAKTPHVLSFSGYTWTVKTSVGRRVGPGPNYFTRKNAWVDSLGRLHLAIAKVGRHWTVGEVVNTRSLGYGTYTWVLASRVDNLDPNMVLGLFTYDSNPAFFNREIDIEASRWGTASDPTNAQFVVQPSATVGNLTRITQGPALPATLSFTWTATGVSFSAPGAAPATWTYTGPDTPPAGASLADINFWLDRGHAPVHGLGSQVIIQAFTFTPA